MLKAKIVLCLIILLSLILTFQNTYSAEEAKKAEKKNPKELVLRIKGASIDELQKLSFFELNILKNAVYASKGYEFAEDRPWLRQIFCVEAKREVKKAAEKRKKAEEATNDKKELPAATSAEAELNRLKQGTKKSDLVNLRKDAKFDLEAYAFPGLCREGGQIDEDQIQAVANIRVAIFKKIESLKSVQEIDKTLDNEFLKMPWDGVSLWVLGKTIPYKIIYMPSAHLSLRRELHGYNRMLQLIKNVEDFDPMELLGLYLSDVMFLRNVIEAKYGKEYPGVLGWEISQISGIAIKKKDYDPKQLPIQIQVKLQMLDEITQKILKSGINDVPASLRNKPIEFFKEEERNRNYGGGAC